MSQLVLISFILHRNHIPLPFSWNLKAFKASLGNQNRHCKINYTTNSKLLLNKRGDTRILCWCIALAARKPKSSGNISNKLGELTQTILLILIAKSAWNTSICILPFLMVSCRPRQMFGFPYGRTSTSERDKGSALMFACYSAQLGAWEDVSSRCAL